MPDFVAQGYNHNTKQNKHEAYDSDETLEPTVNNYQDDESCMKLDTERKTLYDQLRDNKEQKQVEYQRLLGEQNSTYKLTGKDAVFLKKVKEKETMKENSRRKQESKELERFKNLKRIRMDTNRSNNTNGLEVSSKSVSRGIRVVKKLSDQSSIKPLKKQKGIGENTIVQTPKMKKPAKNEEQVFCSDEPNDHSNENNITEKAIHGVVSQLGGYSSDDSI